MRLTKLTTLCSCSVVCSYLYYTYMYIHVHVHTSHTSYMYMYIHVTIVYMKDCHPSAESVLTQYSDVCISSLSAYNESILSSFLRKGNLDVVKYLVTTEVDINARGNDGWTALHLASRSVTKYIITHVIYVLDFIFLFHSCSVDIFFKVWSYSMLYGMFWNIHVHWSLNLSPILNTFSFFCQCFLFLWKLHVHVYI